MYKKILNIFCILIICFLSYKIYSEVNSYIKGNKTYEKVRQESLNFNSLYKNNKDFICFLKIKNTNIDYPVVKGLDNKFYLNHDFYKKKNKLGCLFLDYRCNYNSFNKIIYGHNMINNSMFSELQKFKKEGFFKENNTIKLKINNKIYIYKPFSIYIADSNYNKLIPSFISKKDYQNYLNYIKQKSIYKLPTSLNSKDKIITLVSCDYAKKNTRLIIHGKLQNIT